VGQSAATYSASSASHEQQPYYGRQILPTTTIWGATENLPKSRNRLTMRSCLPGSRRLLGDRRHHGTSISPTFSLSQSWLARPEQVPWITRAACAWLMSATSRHMPDVCCGRYVKNPLAPT
jgi:hypothetical protein